MHFPTHSCKHAKKTEPCQTRWANQYEFRPKRCGGRRPGGRLFFDADPSKWEGGWSGGGGVILVRPTGLGGGLGFF